MRELVDPRFLIGLAIFAITEVLVRFFSASNTLYMILPWIAICFIIWGLIRIVVIPLLKGDYSQAGVAYIFCWGIFLTCFFLIFMVSSSAERSEDGPGEIFIIVPLLGLFMLTHIIGLLAWIVGMLRIRLFK